MAMAPSNFPLRWEIIGDQWWFASPIDWAAANGHYDLVRELLHLDTNLLIKLTSLRRIRRLETVWDDDEEHQFNDVPKQRSLIAQKLLLECESKKGHNSLIRAGYGGWLLYTASSAGDVGFVKELLERNPLLVYGEGEYGVTDILYAGSRSKNSEVFKVLLDYCLRNCMEVSSVYRGEILNRAVHAAARGGNVEVLKELLGDGKDVLSYRDSQGSTLLHTASGKGQVEVVRTLLESYDLMNSTDNQGNTALHIAAYRGNLKVVELLVSSSPSITSMKNSYGDTFLHMAVASFRSPGFRRLDRQMALMRRILSNKDANIEDLINVTNNDGRTALHMAVSENIHSDLVELLMSVPMINLNIRDDDGRTPLDLLKQRPRSASSEILIRRLISAGGTGIGISRNALVSHLKMQGIGGSPGTSFRIPDSEIFLYTGMENEYISGNLIESPNLEMQSGSYKTKISSRLKIMLHLPKKKEIKKMEEEHQNADSEIEDSLSLDSYRNDASPMVRHNPVSLRQRFSKMNSKVVSMPSPSSKKKFAAGLMQGVLQVKRHSSFAASSSPLSRSTWSSPVSTDGERDGRSPGMKTRMKLGQNSFKGVNKYLCFGAQGLNVEDGIRSEQSQPDNRHL